jgi:hypothetical protein
MTSTEFDGSSGAHSGSGGQQWGSTPAEQSYGQQQPSPLGDEANGADLDLSALEQLRSIVETREAAPPWVLTIADGAVRLTCSTDVPNTEYQRWMRASMPKGGRRGVAPDPSRMDQLVLTTRAFIYCTTLVEVRNDKVSNPAADRAWLRVTDRNGTPLKLNDQDMLTNFRTPDAGMLVSRLFGRDADVISKGLELLEKCGYVPGDEDESDPT